MIFSPLAAKSLFTPNTPSLSTLTYLMMVPPQFTPQDTLKSGCWVNLTPTLPRLQRFTLKGHPSLAAFPLFSHQTLTSLHIYNTPLSPRVVSTTTRGFPSLTSFTLSHSPHSQGDLNVSAGRQTLLFVHRALRLVCLTGATHPGLLAEVGCPSLAAIIIQENTRACETLWLLEEMGSALGFFIESSDSPTVTLTLPVVIVNQACLLDTILRSTTKLTTVKLIHFGNGLSWTSLPGTGSRLSIPPSLNHISFEDATLPDFICKSVLEDLRQCFQDQVKQVLMVSFGKMVFVINEQAQ
jgi:hypothetical protein